MADQAALDREAHTTRCRYVHGVARGRGDYMQLEIEVTFSLPLPPGLRAGLSVRRSQDGTQSTQDPQSCIDMGSSPAPMNPCVTSPDDVLQLDRIDDGRL
eukprot:SAG11_NODE_1256_length_5374_cov_5.627627_9_plen_100_part_00